MWTEIVETMKSVTLSCIILKSGQTYFKNLLLLTKPANLTTQTCSVCVQHPGNIYDSIQGTISVIFPSEDKINFSVTKYIWHLKLWQHSAWQISLPKNHEGFPIIGTVFFEILVILGPKKLKNRHFWVTQTSKVQLERVKLLFISFWRLPWTIEWKASTIMLSHEKKKKKIGSILYFLQDRVRDVNRALWQFFLAFQKISDIFTFLW